MELKHLLIMWYALSFKTLFEVTKLVWLPIEFRKIPSVLGQFDPGPSLDDGVEVLFLLALGHGADISWHKWVRNVSKWNKVSNPETLVHSILLFVCEFVKHAAHIWNFIMVCYFWILGVVLRFAKPMVSLKIIFLLLDAMDAWRGANIVLRILTSCHL